MLLCEIESAGVAACSYLPKLVSEDSVVSSVVLGITMYF